MQRRCFGWLGSAALLVAVSVPSLAQAGAPAPQGGAPAPQAGGGGRGGQGRRGVRPLTTVDVPLSTLQTELKLTADQKTKISAIHDKLATAIKESAPPPPAAGQQPDRQAQQDSRTKIRDLNTQATTDIEAVLTDEQKAKLPDVMKGLQLYRSAGIPLEIITDIKLTDDQKKKITDLNDESQKAVTAKFQEIQNGGDRTTIQAAIAVIQKDTHDKILALLTDSQKKTLDAYLKDHPQPAPGGFGGGGGGRRPAAPATPPAA